MVVQYPTLDHLADNLDTHRGSEASQHAQQPPEKMHRNPSAIMNPLPLRVCQMTIDLYMSTSSRIGPATSDGSLLIEVPAPPEPEAEAGQSASSAVPSYRRRAVRVLKSLPRVIEQIDVPVMPTPTSADCANPAS